MMDVTGEALCDRNGCDGCDGGLDDEDDMEMSLSGSDQAGADRRR